MLIWIKKIIKIGLIYISIIIILNCIFWFFASLEFGPEHSGLGFILKIPSTGHVWIFAHGDYESDSKSSEHVTTMNGERIPTFELIEGLEKEGYTYIWLSQCHTGDYPYIKANWTDDMPELLWEDYPSVSRKKEPGLTTPIFLGFGFIRI